jgi:hypothetical protein
MPVWASFLLLVVLTSLAAATGPLLVRRRVGVQQLILNNEIAGFKFATLGVLYGVLLTFVVTMEWAEFSEARDTVLREGAHLRSVAMLAEALPAQERGEIVKLLGQYAATTASEEWPLMRSGKVSAAAAGTLDALVRRAAGLAGSSDGYTSLRAVVLNEVTELAQIRTARLAALESSVPPLLWLVLLTGAVVTTGFTLFFGAENLMAQCCMTGLLCLVLALCLYTVLLLDLPFSGPGALQPDGFQQTHAGVCRLTGPLSDRGAG